MKKLIEHTYGNHIYMALELDNGARHEIDVYLQDAGVKRYETTGDDDNETRAEIIRAFEALY